MARGRFLHILVSDMADEVDQTQEREERILAMNIAALTKAAPVVLATGACLECGEDISEAGRRWCSRACCDMWEDDNKFNR